MVALSDAATERVTPELRAAAGFLLLYLAIAIGTWTSLYADGSFYFTWILEHQRPMDFDPGRHFAHTMTQAPAVAAIRLGMTDLPILTFIFGLGLFAPFALSLALCWWAAGSRKELVLFPLVSFFAVSANSSFFIVSESHLLVALFWALLFTLLLPENWSWRSLLAAAVVALPTLRAYESMAVLGLILAGAALWRASAVRSRALRAGAVAIALWCLAGAALATYGILRPRVATNRTSFLNSLLPLRDHLGHWHGMVAISLLAIGGMTLFLVWKRPRRVGVVVALLLLVALGWSVLPLLQPATVAPFLHYRARSLNLSLTVLLAAALLLVLRFRSRIEPPQWRRAGAVLLVLALAQTIWFAGAAWQWRSYLGLIREEISEEKGLHPFELTTLRETLVNGHPAAAFNWGWTMPTMSILLAREGVVRTVIANPVAERGWQPFNPAEPDSLPRLGRYGIDYRRYITALEASPQ
jgi:hypothetical protein